MTTKLMAFAKNICNLKKHCKTEEATKHSFVLPFFQLLGYNIFDPEEIIPEVDCDIRQCGDKVDYSIAINGEQKIIVECKQNKDKQIDRLISLLEAKQNQ